MLLYLWDRPKTTRCRWQTEGWIHNHIFVTFYEHSFIQRLFLWVYTPPGGKVKEDEWQQVQSVTSVMPPAHLCSTRRWRAWTAGCQEWEGNKNILSCDLKQIRHCLRCVWLSSECQRGDCPWLCTKKHEGGKYPTRCSAFTALQRVWCNCTSGAGPDLYLHTNSKQVLAEDNTGRCFNFPHLSKRKAGKFVLNTVRAEAGSSHSLPLPSAQMKKAARKLKTSDSPPPISRRASSITWSQKWLTPLCNVFWRGWASCNIEGCH